MESRSARWQSPLPEDRIRRNVACVNCRNSKVRCKQSARLGEPCQRCSKLGASCVVDKSHKRITKRSKIDKLEKELDAIKQAVHVQPQPQPQPQAQSSASNGETGRSSLPLSRSDSHSHTQPQSQRPAFHLTPNSLPEPTPSSASVPVAPPPPVTRPVKSTPTQPRTIGSYNLSGADVDYYFDKYLECFHHFIPILRKLDPDECFEAEPTLFWIIIFVAARRYAKDPRIFGIIVENLSKDVWALLSNPMMGLEAIHCLLLICTWPLPTIRFASDPSAIFAGTARHSCMLLGLHTGKGSHHEFCFTSRVQLACSNEEASCTWIQACIISQRTASSVGHPPPSIQLNDSPAKKELASPEWTDLLVEFDIQKFLNRLHSAMASHVASNGFVIESMVNGWEDELETIRSIVSQHDTDISRFMLLSAKQDVLAYYFCHDPNHPGPNITLNHTRALTGAKSLISTALALESTPTKLISHGPHWVFRAIVDAACQLTSALHSSFPPPLDHSSADDPAQHLFEQCHAAVLACSVRDGDLPYRAACMMQGFWSCREQVPLCEPGPAMAWPNRVGASITYWCFSRFHRGLSEAQKNSESARRALREIQIPKQQQENKEKEEQESQTNHPDDFFQEVDWSLFMDDIGWGTGDAIFMGLP